MWFLTIEASIKTPHCCHLAAKFWTWVKITRFNGQKVFIANVDLNLIHFHESSFLLKVTQTDSISRHVSCSTNYSWPISAWKCMTLSKLHVYWGWSQDTAPAASLVLGGNDQTGQGQTLQTLYPPILALLLSVYILHYIL